MALAVGFASTVTFTMRPNQCITLPAPLWKGPL